MTTRATLPDSFAADDSRTATAPNGAIARREMIAHGDLFERKLWTVRPGVWCLVGNGLSNQTFVEGPDGLIAIDTGESIEEMRAALAEVRRETQAPLAAVIYTHFHYVGGTAALFDDGRGVDVPIWGHAGIVANRLRMGAEVSAAATRGLVQQFGILLPPDGPDGLVNVGLGKEFRSADHAPFSNGFIPPTHTIEAATRTTLAGLQVELELAPSDADDSITIWIPELGVCINNLVWPALFNVYAIRGEEYRDPRLLLTGLDRLLELAPEHLVGTHGPPLAGRERIREDVCEYRDAIQFLWDQTVRGINRGLTLGELCEAVQLPKNYQRSHLTRQHYGLVEHHVRQIHAGLRGWFDGDEAMLFPLPPAERARRLVEGFGGAAVVRAQVQTPLGQNDLRWALELATWLVRADADADDRRPLADAGSPSERALLADVLRAIAARTTSANIRNWCLTRARELDGLLDLSRLRVHRFAREQVHNHPPAAFVHALRVLLDPARAEGVDQRIHWSFDDGSTAGLHLRRCVAVPDDGTGIGEDGSGEIELGLACDLDTWAQILSTRLTLSKAIEAGVLRVIGDEARLRAVLACFDHPTLAQ